MVAAAWQPLCAKALTEFLGTMFLCLTVATAAKTSVIAPLAIGCVLMVCIYAGGHISGAHYNPAVTLAVLVGRRGKLRMAHGALYVACQLAGACCAMLLSWVLVGRDAAAFPKVTAGMHPLSFCLCEAMIAFALCSVVLHTATTKAQAGNSHFGLAIGFTVLSGAVSVGGISGGAFNPAVGSMCLFYGKEAASDVWVYWLGPLAGGVLAGIVFRASAWQEFCDTASDLEKMLTPCLVELVGTMMLCFTVGTAGGFLAPLAIGSMLMAMIYMGAWVSGGHFNPAVTLAVWVRSLLGAVHGPFGVQQALRYVFSQLVGAALGTLAALGAGGTKLPVAFPSVPTQSTEAQAFVGEVLGTFLLAYTVLNVATVKQTAGNSFYGLAIGMAVTAMACSVGPVGGGAFNPAVGIMGLLIDGQVDVWIYWSACPLGALLAAAAYQIQNFEEFNPDQSEAQPPIQARTGSCSSIIEKIELDRAARACESLETSSRTAAAQMEFAEEAGVAIEV